MNALVWTPKKARPTQNREQGSMCRYNGDKANTELPSCDCSTALKPACEFGLLW